MLTSQMIACALFFIASGVNKDNVSHIICHAIAMAILGSAIVTFFTRIFHHL